MQFCLWRVACLNGIFVTMNFNLTLLGGENEEFAVLLTSSDCISWTEVSEIDNFINAITVGNDKIVAVGDSGKIYSSSDGISWTTFESGISGMQTSISYDGEKFVILGENGVCLTSPDDGIIAISGNPSKIKPRAEESLSLRIVNSSLHISIPDALRGSGSMLQVYRPCGRRIMTKFLSNGECTLDLPTRFFAPGVSLVSAIRGSRMQTE
jgi:hypothetical protein